MGHPELKMAIKNRDVLATTKWRRDALLIAEVGLEAIDTKRLIKNSLRLESNPRQLCIATGVCSLAATRRIFAVAVGKCALPAAAALEEVLGEALTGGLVLDVQIPATVNLSRFKYFRGTHPLPSDQNITHTKEIVKLLADLQDDDLVIFVISGGGSTLLCLPEAEGTCLEERTIIQMLLGSGATIQEINTIRKHLSLARGGFLAQQAYPAQVISLIISDVPGDDISLVASGPTVKDPTTREDASRILEKYQVLRACGLEQCGLIETPKDDRYFEKVTNILLATNAVGLEAMATEARRLGYQAQIVNRELVGEAREVGREIVAALHQVAPKTVLLYGGETTVTLTGSAGRGGRNQELALAALADVMANEVVVAMASDGHDNSEYAGALVDTLTRQTGVKLHLDSTRYLNGHDALTFFEQTTDYLLTGTTGANFSDFLIAVKGEPVSAPAAASVTPNVLWLPEVGIDDVACVGGKNASLGEMIRELGSKGVRVPSGFVVTAEAYRRFLQAAGLEQFIRETLVDLDTREVEDLARRSKRIREQIVKSSLPPDLAADISRAYAELERQHEPNIDVAVRSSATAEDLPGASFAGEHETYLGIRGVADVLQAVKAAMASLFTARAVSYRVDKGFDHFAVALSVAVQQMVRSDTGASGVMFTLDTESGFRDVVLINSTWGLGELIVQGQVVPDEFLLFKKTLESAPEPIIYKKLGTKATKMIYRPGRGGLRPVKVVSVPKAERELFTLTNGELLTLARWGLLIEAHYTEKRGHWTPMDIEWAKDGPTGDLYIVQARPETVHAERDFSKLTEYRLTETGPELVRGVSVGSKVAVGPARIILDVKDIGQFKAGEVLVTDMTDPDWEPIMKIAAAIITDKGGRTSHAAIVSRELGIPAVVGTESATRKITTGELVTVDTSGSAGVVFRGALKFEVIIQDVKLIPSTRTHIMMNIATPDTAFEKSFLPNQGVGLAREEFIIASTIGIHPLALLNFPTLPPVLQRAIAARTKGWSNKTEFYVDNLAYGIGRIAAAFYPKPVIVRFSDFKTNEYRALLGGELYEPTEENPMIGWRGASRYYDPKFREAFKLECRALKKVRDRMGLVNIVPMVPFCRTPAEGIKTLELMAGEGLVSRFMAERDHLSAATIIPVYVMCEIPSNVILAEEFLAVFDGMSIGSNDLTQLVLGLDRDSGMISRVADEQNPAVKKLIADIVRICQEKNKYIGICGQAPSDHPDFALFLVEAGIDSMSLTPDTVVKTTIAVAAKEQAH